MASSVSDALIDQVVLAIQALGLTLPGSDMLAVIKRKIPAATEGVDEPPLIAVVPSERPGIDRPFSTEDALAPHGRRYREYVIQVVIIAPGDRDNVTGLSDYQHWKQRIARRFGRPDPLPAVAELVATHVDPGAVLERPAHGLLYDCSAIGLRFGCVEPAE